jgi:hypothetical protein
MIPLLHRLRHWFHWQPVEVVSEWRDTELWIGARCVICGEVTGWHASRLKRQLGADNSV